MNSVVEQLDSREVDECVTSPHYGLKNRSGKIVSTKKSILAKKGKIGKWAVAFVKARKALGIKGFVAVKKGSALYKKTLSFYKK